MQLSWFYQVRMQYSARDIVTNVKLFYTYNKWGNMFLIYEYHRSMEESMYK